MSRSISTFIKAELSKLSHTERSRMICELQSIIDQESFDLATEDSKEPLVCHGCGSIHVVKRGHTAKGTQRYRCYDCGNSFVKEPSTIFSQSKLSKDVWKRYIECFIDCLSLRACADKCDISLKTSFFMRHRILEALYAYIPSFRLKENGGVIVDETFVRENFKGNYTHSEFKLPREARHRGGENHVRGISHEQICILTGINDNGDMFYEIACRGRLTSNVAHDLLKEKIGAGSIVVTDKHRAYPCALKELKVACHSAYDSKVDHAPLNPINALHSRLKTFLGTFRGVSTRRLSNYLAWFKWIETFRRANSAQNTCNLVIKQLFQGDYRTTWRSYKATERPFMDYWEAQVA